MRIRGSVLARFTDVPEGRALRSLLDDVGVEVKKMDGDDLTVELLANRGDHYCYQGIAREVVGRTGGRLDLPEIAVLDVGTCPIELRNETELCLKYTGTLLVRDAPGHAVLDDAAVHALEGAGLQSVSAPVDATNLANLELGQPTHAFDADTIDGAVVIRTSREGETAWPLFTEERVTLREGTLVIADDTKILAIAGVIGCEESKTTDATTRLLLESACFDPVSVRKASRGLAIHTDSSARFERGSDPIAPLVGAGRVVHLLESQAGWRREGETGQVGDWTDPVRVISVDVAACNAFLHLDLTAEQTAERLGRYGFSCEVSGDQLQVLVPPHRLWDVEFPADLYEEIAKSIGYNDSPVALPPVDMGAIPSPAEVRKRRTEEVLIGNGFYEVFTDGFYSRAMISRLGLFEGHPLYAHVETTNALDRGYSLLKNNCLAQAVEAVAKNIRMRVTEVKAYEWTRTFHPDASAANGVCRERKVLWGICVGSDRPDGWDRSARGADVYFVKNLVGELATELGLPLELGHAESHLSSCLHSGRQSCIRMNGVEVGVMGEVHPSVLKAWKIKRARPVYFEIDADALLAAGSRPAFVEPLEWHPIVRSLAFTVPQRTETLWLSRAMREAGPDALDTIDIVDVFVHEQDGAPVKTFTWSLSFANVDNKLTADAVNAAIEAIAEAVTGQFDGVSRRV